jgi:uncharacterized protein (DUF2345 family)
MEGASALQAFTDSASDGLSDQAVATQEKASALSDAIESGASPEVTAAAFMGLAASALDTLSAPMKMIEGLIAQIPNIELWAMKDVNAHALWSMTLSTKTRDITIQAQNKDIGISAKKNINIVAATEDIVVNASKKNIQITGKENISIKAEDKNLVIEAGKELSLKCGKAEIILKENGDITLKGKDIVNKTKSKFAVKASGAVSFKGSTVSEK